MRKYGFLIWILLLVVLLCGGILLLSAGARIWQERPAVPLDRFHYIQQSLRTGGLSYAAP